MPKRGENIFLRKDGRWEARLTVTQKDGAKKRLSFYGKSYKQVKEARSKYFEQPLVSHIDASPTMGPKNVTVKDVVEYWLQDQYLNTKPASYLCYKNSMEKHILPYLGTIQYMDLTAERVQQEIHGWLQAQKLSNSRALSKKTIRDTFSSFKNALTHYGEAYHLDRTWSFKLPKATPRPAEILSNADQKKLGSYLKTDVDAVKIGIYLVLYTGLRIGELCALRWKDVDFESKVLRVRASVRRRSKEETQKDEKPALEITSPKSQSSYRDVPLAPFLHKRLKEYYSQSHLSPNFYLLSEDSYKPMDPRTLQNHFKKILAKLDIQQISFHKLRHTFATNCLQQGIDPKTVSKILGHSDVTTTLRVYVHVTSKNMQAQIANLRELIDEQ